MVVEEVEHQREPARLASKRNFSAAMAAQPLCSYYFCSSLLNNEI